MDSCLLNGFDNAVLLLICLPKLDGVKIGAKLYFFFLYIFFIFLFVYFFIYFLFFKISYVIFKKRAGLVCRI